MPNSYFRAMIGFAMMLGVLESQAAVGVGIFLKNADEFIESSRVEYSITAFNNGTAPVTVDVHLGVIRNGVVYEYPDWNTSLTPWLRSFSIPANYYLPPYSMGDLSSFPGGLEPGVYELAVALARPGTLDLLALEYIPFVVRAADEAQWEQNLVLFARGESSAESLLETDAYGVFTRVNLDPSLFANAVAQGTPTIEQCIYGTSATAAYGFFPLAEIIDDRNITTLNAGAELRLSSPTLGSVGIPRESFANEITYENSRIAQNFYQPGRQYDLQVNGGLDVPAFTISTSSPPKLVLTLPADASRTHVIDSAKNLSLGWQGNNGVGEVAIVMAYEDDDLPEAIACRFADDGTGVIPANLLAQLRANAPQAGAPITLAIARMKRNMSTIRAGAEIEFLIVDAVGLRARF
jgi:hypothetical protein